MPRSVSYLPRVWLGSQISTTLLPPKIRPLAAHLKLTENCQAKCITCDYWKTRWQDAISTERAIELINEIGDLGIGSIRFTGGEPLLRKDFFRILEQAKSSSFKHMIVQTNGLLLKKLHSEVNDSPLTKIAVSIDGLKETNDRIRGIRGYFDLALQGIQLLRNKEIVLSVTLNKASAEELEDLSKTAAQVGAAIEINILSRNLFFFQNSDITPLWPRGRDVSYIAKFLADTLKRPAYEVDYVSRYYKGEKIAEPPCVLGFLQVFILSNGDVLTGCYPLPPVGNILRESLASVLQSDAYHRQCRAMLRRECPGCTCGVESSLAMKHAVSSAFFEIRRLKLASVTTTK
ncbi:MAG TPA: radical SAM protein [Bryobacteraceae bacterium]|nr:radical SAM protein [Bryobacteraceae bacterium]